MGGRLDIQRVLVRGCDWIRAWVLIAFVTAWAHADPLEYGGQRYQLDLVDRVRGQNQLEIDPQPEGKIIERIVTLPQGVILPAEPYPMFLNGVHVTTLPQVVERELLFQVGQPWTNDAVIESAHNLRSYLYLTAAQIVACRGSSPNQVTVLVVTKDLWSLRPNFNFLISDVQLQTVSAQLTEQNLLGRMKQATVDFGFDPGTYYGGLRYLDPRLLGGDFSMFERGDLIWNRTTGALEGGVTTFTFQKPLYNLDTEWGWIATTQYRNDVFNFYSSGFLAAFTSPTTGQLLPYQYYRHMLDSQFGVTRSYGREHKRDISAGYRGFVHLYSPTPQAVAVLPATQADFSSTVLPMSESSGMLYVGFHAYPGYYHSLIDIQEFALSEDFHFGLDCSLELRLANAAFGFSSSYFEPVLNVTWTNYSNDDLFVASAALDIRYQPSLQSFSPWTDGLATLTLRNVSPRFSFLRFHTGVQLARRYDDFTNGFSAIGGDTSLRGYPSAFFYGKNYWGANAELRTLPLALASVHIGMATFFDMGSAANDITQLTPYESAGAGFRIGFPQFNKEVLRLDFGFPLSALPGGASPAYFVAEYGQAF